MRRVLNTLVYFFNSLVFLMNNM